MWKEVTIIENIYDTDDNDTESITVYNVCVHSSDATTDGNDDDNEEEHGGSIDSHDYHSDCDSL